MAVQDHLLRYFSIFFYVTACLEFIRGHVDSFYRSVGNREHAVFVSTQVIKYFGKVHYTVI